MLAKYGFLRLYRLDRLLFRMYIGPLILTFFIAIFVLLMQFLWKYIDDLVGKGLDFWILAELLFYASLTFIPLALPISILLSSLMTFGSFGEHYELAASKSVGISLMKMMRPLIILSLLISITAFYLSNNVLPYANLKMTALLYDVSNAKPTLNIREGIFYREIDNVVIKVGRKEKDGNTIKNIIIYDHSKYMGNVSVTIAETGYMEVTEDEKYLLIKLYNGHSYNELLDKREHYETRPMETVHFKEKHKFFDLSSFALQKTDEEFFKDHYQMMSVEQLKICIDSLKEEKTQKYNTYANQFINYWHFFIMADTSILSNHQTTSELISTHVDFLENIQPKERKTITENALKSAQNLHEVSSYFSYDISYLQKHFLRFNVELHRKFTLSVACLILFFIGAPLGAIIRKGGLGLPLVVASLIFVFYYVMSITGEKFVREGVWHPVFGMWMSSFVLFPLGLWLTIKTIKDSPLMDAEAWYKFITTITQPLHKFIKIKK